MTNGIGAPIDDCGTPSKGTTSSLSSTSYIYPILTTRPDPVSTCFVNDLKQRNCSRGCTLEGGRGERGQPELRCLFFPLSSTSNSNPDASCRATEALLQKSVIGGPVLVSREKPRAGLRLGA